LSLSSKKIEYFFSRWNKIQRTSNNYEYSRTTKTILQRFSNTLANGKITPEQACSLIEKVRDAKMFPDEIDTEDNQQKGFYEIAWLFADWKITTEEACEAFKEWTDEWKPVKN
jgi:hypothetical protein